jgi:hypothetical protein
VPTSPLLHDGDEYNGVTSLFESIPETFSVLGLRPVIHGDAEFYGQYQRDDRSALCC